MEPLLNVEDNIIKENNIDIKKFVSLIAFIKRKSVGQLSKKSSVLTKSEVETFLKEADDTTYLMMKVKFNNKSLHYPNITIFVHYCR